MPLTAISPRGYETITTFDSGRGLGMEFTCIPTGAPASSTWPSSNLAIASPIYIDSYGTVVKMFMANGATASGNFDIGLYDENFNRLVSSGAVAQSGTGAIQTFDVTDTPVRPGRHYIAISSSAATGTLVRLSVGPLYLRPLGVVQMAAAHPLPATITPAAVANSFVFLAGLSYRVTI
jgi:hypothetical protein